MRSHQQQLRDVFLNGLALLAITLAIFVMVIHVSTIKRQLNRLHYVGEGMALCHSDFAPGKDGWITLEFIEFERVVKNTFSFTLRDGTKVEGNLPCVINFDRKPD